MYTFSPEVFGAVPFCADIAEYLNRINENCKLDVWAVLWSLMRTLKQPAYFDFYPSKRVHLPDSHKPLLPLVALEANTFWDVWVVYKQLLDDSLTTSLCSTRIVLNSGMSLSLLVIVFMQAVHTGRKHPPTLLFPNLEK